MEARPSKISRICDPRPPVEPVFRNHRFNESFGSAVRIGIVIHQLRDLTGQLLDGWVGVDEVSRNFLSCGFRLVVRVTLHIILCNVPSY
jgi:hypothetical protein